MALVDIVSGTGYMVAPSGVEAKFVMDSGGNIWCLYVVGTSLYCQKSTDGGVTWGAPETAVTESYSGSDGIEFDVGVDSLDNIHVVYRVRTGTSSQNRLYHLIRTAGTGWGAKSDILGVQAYYKYPKIAIDSVDNIHCVYHYGTLGSASTRYLKRASGVWGSATSLAGYPKTQYNSQDICVDSFDNVHAVYGKSDYLYYRLYTGGVWQAEELIGNLAFGSYTWTLVASILVDSSDIVHIVWTSAGYGVNSSMAQVLHRKGNTGAWGSIEQLTDATQPQGAPYGMSAAINNLDEIDVCFAGSRWSITNPVWLTGNHIKYSAGAWGSVEVLVDYNFGNVYGMLWAKFPSFARLPSGYIVGMVAAAPTVSTQGVTDVLPTSVTGNGTIVGTGGLPVTQHGHCWSTSPNPTIADSHTENGPGVPGAFTSPITGLALDIVWHTRAYAINACGVSYGADSAFRTNPETVAAFVTAGWDGSLTNIDVTDPTVPLFKSNLQGFGSPNWLDGITDIQIIGNLAYVVSYYDDSLTIIDIFDPSAPVLVGSIQGAGAPNYLGGAQGIDVVGNYAYIAAYGDGALTIIDVSDPSHPTFVGTILADWSTNFLGGAYHVRVVGSYAYVAAYYEDSLTVIDISNPAAPTYVGHIQTDWATLFLGGPRHVEVVGNYAYVASFYEDALTIVDISNPAAPAHVGSIYGGGAPPWLSGAQKFTLVGNYAYVVCAYDDALTIIDISNPAAPSFVGSIQGSGSPNFLGWAQGIAVVGNYAYVAASNDNALSIFDISVPTTPTLVGSIQGNWTPNYLGGASAVAIVLFTVVPTVTTDPASSIGTVNADLNGTLDDDRGEACDCGFEWGETIAYGNTTPTQSRTSGQTLLQVIIGLSPGTIYHFRAFATNSAGTGYGADRTFTTKKAPVVETYGVTNVELDSAILIGELIDDGDEACEVGFEWGLTALYGKDTIWQSGKHTGDTFWQLIASLEPDTTYHFRAQARNSAASASGADMTFKTLTKPEAEAIEQLYSSLDPSLLLLMEEQT